MTYADGTQADGRPDGQGRRRRSWCGRPSRSSRAATRPGSRWSIFLLFATILGYLAYQQHLGRGEAQGPGDRARSTPKNQAKSRRAKAQGGHRGLSWRRLASPAGADCRALRAAGLIQRPFTRLSVLRAYHSVVLEIHHAHSQIFVSQRCALTSGIALGGCAYGLRGLGVGAAYGSGYGYGYYGYGYGSTATATAIVALWRLRRTAIVRPVTAATAMATARRSAGTTAIIIPAPAIMCTTAIATAMLERQPAALLDATATGVAQRHYRPRPARTDARRRSLRARIGAGSTVTGRDIAARRHERHVGPCARGHDGRARSASTRVDRSSETAQRRPRQSAIAAATTKQL